MACNKYNNNGFGCGGCIHFVKTTDVTITGDTLILNIPESTYTNKEKVCICITQQVPTDILSTDIVVVTIGNNATQYPIITKCGNHVYADQLRARKVYHTSVATDLGAFVVSPCELCPTSFNFPVIPTVTPVVENK